MKIKLLLASTLTLAAVQANAAVGVLIRSDYYNNSKMTDTSGLDLPGVSVFAPTVARLNASGSVGDAKVYLGLNLRSFEATSSTTIVGGTASTTAYRTMTVDKFVETAYITKSLGDFTVSIGKLNVNVGGYESIQTVSGDDYSASLANGSTMGLVSFAGASTATTIATPDNPSTIEVAYAIHPDHKVTLQISNQVNATTGSATVATTGAVGPTVTKATNRKNMIGLQYEGSFADKMAEVLVQYTAGASDTDTLATTTNTMSSATEDLKYLSGGFKIQLPANMSAMVEYFDNSSLPGTAGAKKSTTTSMVGTLRFNIDAFQPILSFESSENKRSEDAAASGSFKRTAYTAAVEYVPKAGENFRYHVAYNGFSDKYGTPGLTKDTVTNTQIIAGIKYSGDFLK